MASFITFAYFLLGLGPGLAFYIVFIVPKSFLVLLTFTSTFYWLLVLLFTSAIFRGFLPVTQAQTSYAGLLVAAVGIQEAARLLLWRVHSKTAQVLDSHARQSGHRFHLIDKLYLALGWGWGHGAAHVIFFYLSFLPLTTGNGTWYLETCPDFSIFLGGALYSLAFSMLLPSLMIVAWEGLHERHWLHLAWAPVAHMGASLVTLLNFRQHGCLTTFPVLLAFGALNMAYAGQLIWRKGMSEGQSPDPSASVTPLVHASDRDRTFADGHHSPESQMGGMQGGATGGVGQEDPEGGDAAGAQYGGAGTQAAARRRAGARVAGVSVVPIP